MLAAELGVLDRSITLRRAAGMPIGAGELGAPRRHRPRDPGRRVGPRPAHRARVRREPRARPAREAGCDRPRSTSRSPRTASCPSSTPRSRSARPARTTRSRPRCEEPGDVQVDRAVRRRSRSSTRSARRTYGAARASSRAARQKLEVTAFDIRAQIAQTMARAVAQLELANRRVVLAQRAIELANENIKIETDRFNLGKATNFDVLNRLEELRQAELRKRAGDDRLAQGRERGPGADRRHPARVRDLARLTRGSAPARPVTISVNRWARTDVGLTCVAGAS